MDYPTLLRKIDETCAAAGMDLHLDDFMRPMPFAFAKARISGLQSPVLNLVGMATLAEENADEAIQSVIEAYRKEGKVFGWMVGPTSSPKDLGERLVAGGLQHIEEEAMFGMVLNNLNHAIPVNPDIRVEEVTIADCDRNAAMMADAYGFSMTEEVVRGVIRFYEAMGKQAKVYFAYVNGKEDPVAFCGSIFDEDGEVIALGGSATLAEYRGRGIYRTMVAKRLADARELGVTTAIIQAVKTTSAPICAKLGFESVCEIDLYAYIA